MKKEEIHLWDIKRILLGNAPPEFLLEVFIRTLIIYVAAIVVLRFLGKRMNGQLTITEMAVMILMGAIIAVPMQVPDRGLLQGILLLMLMLLFLRGINLIAFNNSKFEKLTQGDVSVLIKDGVICLDELEKARISHKQLFSKLREKEVYNLALVKRAYLESNGSFSIYKNKEPSWGLSTFPSQDEPIYRLQKTNGLFACNHCGTVQEKQQKGICIKCGSSELTKAIE